MFESKIYAIYHLMDVYIKWSHAMAHEKNRNQKASEAGAALWVSQKRFGSMPKKMLADNGNDFIVIEFWRWASL